MSEHRQDPKTLGWRLYGVQPVFQTPFREDEHVDFDTLAREIDWIFDSGANGVVMAMASETLRLSTGERKELAEHVHRFVAGRGTTTISVGAESALVSEQLAIHAREIGADAVMAIPPVATPASEAEILRYYQRIIEATDLGVVIQDASAYVGRPMPIDLQAGLFRSYGPRIMFKPEAQPLGPQLSALFEATGKSAAILEGSGGIVLVDSFYRGAAGTMPGADLVDVIVALWRALEEGDESKVDRLSLPLVSIISKLPSLDAYVAVEKYLLKKRGVFTNTVVRGPVGFQLDDLTRQEMDRLLGMLIRAMEQEA
jgi:4-hydroxy-tetrahydrodipicolinate synthase